MFIGASKVFCHTDRIQAYLAGERVLPISVKMRLTDKCNLECYYCSYKGNLTHESMSLSNALNCLDKLKLMGVKGLVFTGGEPTLHPDFEGIVKAAKEEYGFDVALITNGVVYCEVAQYLTWVRFSLDTVDEEVFEKIKGHNRLKAVMNTIESFIEDKEHKGSSMTVGIQAIVNKHNFDYQFSKIRNVIKYALSVGADYVQVRPLENYAYGKEELFIIKDNLKDLKEYDFGIKVITTGYKWYEVEKGYKRDYSGCPSADFIGSVDVKGDFYICCATINDRTARYGNLMTDSAEEILLNRKAVQAGFDYRKCTTNLICQGSLLNQTLSNFKEVKHINFV